MTHLHQWASTLLAGLLAFGCFGVAAQAQPETLRVEVIKPLQQAQELNKQNKNTEALARFAEVDALPAGNPLEVFTIERLRAVVHMAAGNSAAAAKAIEKALQTERGTVADRVALMENLVLIQYRAKQYADAALWAGRYLALGGQREALKASLMELQSLLQAMAAGESRRSVADVAQQQAKVLQALTWAWDSGITDLDRLLAQRVDGLFARMWLHLGTALVLLGCILSLVTLVARQIAKPLQHLAKVADEVRHSGDHSLRARWSSRDF